MKYLYEKQIVKLDYGSSGNLLLLDESGKRTIGLFYRARLEAMSMNGIHFSGFEKKIGRNGIEKYRYVELFFVYVQ